VNRQRIALQVLATGLHLPRDEANVIGMNLALIVLAGRRDVARDNILNRARSAADANT